MRKMDALKWIVLLRLTTKKNLRSCERNEYNFDMTKWEPTFRNGTGTIAFSFLVVAFRSTHNFLKLQELLVGVLKEKSKTDFVKDCTSDGFTPL